MASQGYITWKRGLKDAIRGTKLCGFSCAPQRWVGRTDAGGTASGKSLTEFKKAIEEYGTRNSIKNARNCLGISGLGINSPSASAFG